LSVRRVDSRKSGWWGHKKPICTVVIMFWYYIVNYGPTAAYHLHSLVDRILRLLTIIMIHIKTFETSYYIRIFARIIILCMYVCIYVCISLYIYILFRLVFFHFFLINLRRAIALGSSSSRFVCISYDADLSGLICRR